jgi:hypothetical protein
VIYHVWRFVGTVSLEDGEIKYFFYEKWNEDLPSRNICRRVATVPRPLSKLHKVSI